MKSEQPSLTPIATPADVRWREVRIRFLPPLAFSGALLLAAVLWQRAVVPVLVEPPSDPPLGSEEPSPALVSPPPVHHQASHTTSNGVYTPHSD